MLYLEQTNGLERKLIVLFEAIVTIITDYLYPAFLVIFFFGFTIFIHELGHFWLAKKRGMKIERFSIGFGPKIWGKTIDGIDYRVSWIPFGGYVSLPQMSPMEVIEGKSESPVEELPPATPLSKILVAIAGPVMNLILAFILASLVWHFGLPRPVNPPIVGGVEEGSREEQLGVLTGDRIVQVNDRDIKEWFDIQRTVALSRGETVSVVIDRNGEKKQFELDALVNEVLGVRTLNLYPQGHPFAGEIDPDSAAARGGLHEGDKFLSVEGIPISSSRELIDLISKQTNKPTEIKVLRHAEVKTLIAIPEYNEEAKAGRLGVPLQQEVEYEVQRPGPPPLEQFKEIFALMGDTFNALIHHKETGVGPKSLSGPVGIATGWWQEISRGGVRRGMWFAVLLNLNLAIINLLPLPVLDGGHIVFSIIEAIRRKPLNARLAHALSVAFAFMLISFMLYVTFFDIQRLGWLRSKSSNDTPASNSVPSEVTPLKE